MEDLTIEEEAGLRELGEDLQAARRSAWQPRLVGALFGRGEKARLTMQGWIDLDWVKSPLLEGEYPLSMEQIDAVFRAFGEEWEGLTPEATLERLRGMKEATEEAFGAIMPMSPPNGGSAEAQERGMGSWLPMLACLVGEMRIPPAAALALPVGQAFALIAGLRANQGWTPRGESYRDREIL